MLCDHNFTLSLYDFDFLHRSFFFEGLRVFCITLKVTFWTAQTMYENALASATLCYYLGSDVAEGLSTVVLYNLARIYEDAILLSRHPEYIHRRRYTTGSDPKRS
jgi:hypothetical protein